MSIRNRGVYAALAAGTIAIGLWIHQGGLALSPDVRDVTGDALWAAMIVWLISALWPAAPLVARSIAALCISAAVEISQLVHTPWLDALRHTVAGQLVLGNGFNPRDLLAYAAGIAAAAALERALCYRRPEHP